MLRCNPKAISKVLCKLFNYILKNKTFPEIWNISLIKPLHKSGSTAKHDNYRGICISNHLSKLFTLILNKRLQAWADQNDVIPDQSLGFRKGLRTEDGLFVLNSILDKYARKGQKVYACFVDFAKFYDSISHDLLFLKLAQKRVVGNFYFLLKNMYGNCKYAVKVQLPVNDVKGKNSSNISYKWYTTTNFRSVVGLKQGCNLSPSLANIYLSDLHHYLKMHHVHAPLLFQRMVTSITWADDLLITSLHHDGLQNCLDNLNNYCQEWGLEVSLKKTRCVIFSKGHCKYELQKDFFIGDKIIKFENFYKYLGVEINDNSEFTLVKKQRVIKARKAIIMLKQLLSTTGNVSVKLAKALFESKIEPILMYGSIVWATEKSATIVSLNGLNEVNQSDNIRNVVNNFFKQIWGDYCPVLDLVRRTGKKADPDRSILIKFHNIQDKEKLLYETDNIPNGIKIRDNYKSSGCLEIEQVQDRFIKYCINVPRKSCNMISRAELGKFPIQIKVHAQMVKYFVRLAQGTSNDLLNDAFKCTMGNNSQWVQTITKILKSVGYAYVLNDLECYMDWFLSLICENYIFKHFVKTVEPTSLKFCTIIELITLHLEYTIAQVKYANSSYAHAQTFVLLNGEMATVSTGFRKLKFWLWLLRTVFYLNQTGF